MKLILSIAKRIVYRLEPEGFARFILSRIRTGAHTPLAPMLDAKKISMISKYITSSDEVLEFGSGGSTIEISRQCGHLTTIESDRAFLRGVEKTCSNYKIKNVSFFHADIGPTTWYGYPVPFLRIIMQGKYNYYYTSLWKRGVLKSGAKMIIIDGRFRVATFFTIVKENPCNSFVVVFDDFIGRPEYEEVLNHYTPTEYSGSAAIFKIEKKSSTKNDELILKYSRDPR